MDENRLGSILLEGGIVDVAGLERCLAIQGLTGNTRPIGQILVEQGLLDPKCLERLLELQRTRRATSAAAVPAQDLASASLLGAAKANGASELVVSEGRPARVRVGSTWRQLTDEVLSGPEVWDFVRETMGTSVLEQLAEHHFVVQPWRLADVGAGAATAFRQFDGVAVRITFVEEGVPSPEQVGVPPAVLDAIRAGKGLVLCVGERGIGRGELIATFVREAAKDPSHYVVVVDDDPVDLPTEGAMVVQRRFGIDPETRARVLRSVVGEDPDAIVIADAGSPESFELALRAAEGGRLVVAYLDAQNVVAALRRILNFYPGHELQRVRASLAAVLRAVFVRHLIPDAAQAGLVPATELLVADDAAREVLRRGELDDLALLLRATDRASGHSLDRSLLDLVSAGKVRMEDVFAHAEEKAWLLDRTRHLDLEAC